MDKNIHPAVSGTFISNGFQISFRKESYKVTFPERVWKRVPKQAKSLLLDNIVFAATMHLPMMLPDTAGLLYDTATPCFEPLFFQNFLRDIPSCCDMDGLSCSAETERFLNTDYLFNAHNIKQPQLWPAPALGEAAASPEAAAIIPMSFGKDSLLSFAVAEELGLNPAMVFVDEPGFSQERAHKEELGRRFFAEFGKPLHILEHESGLLRDAAHLGVAPNEYGWGLQSTEYALLMLPFARAFGAGHIFFGNEQTTGSSYRDSSGRWTVYPCYDQTHRWTRHINGMIAGLTQPEPVQVGSLIEPLMDMMVQRILVNRYPQYAGYQMSCFAEGAAGKKNRWCHECFICAKMYLLCLAGAVDPKAIGFESSMLTRKHAHHFSIFGGGSEFPYSRTDDARDEQLFAFHCAAHFAAAQVGTAGSTAAPFGAKDELVQDFADSPLAEEAKARETELFSKFIRIYPAITLPELHQDSLMSIYEDELNQFTKIYEEA